ncbi:MAG: RluA family pseudouridine synthase [Saprospiraceae bacterium]|nr:RluA family pseudouridine synthase [Saprospiraceae bacterium]
MNIKGLKIIYEDNHLIAVNKEAGVLVHGDETGDTTLADMVKYYIKQKYNKPGDVFLGVIHRIDRPVSGVVVFARTSKALTRMNEMLRDKQIRKKYFALVSFRPDPLSGTLTHHLVKDSSKNIVKAHASPKKDTKEAVLEYELKGELDGKVLLEIRPITGRPHQIRVQLSKIGSPIIGDLKYGGTYALPDQSIGLHCSEMQFKHPVKDEIITIKAATPKKFPWNIFTYY